MNNKKLIIFLAVLVSMSIILINGHVLVARADINPNVLLAKKPPLINGWRQISTPPETPPAREGHSLVYDSARGVVVLFGGANYFSDTWEWDGVNWIQRTPANSPSPRYAHVMSFDSARGVAVLFGGYSQINSQRLDDTWEWDGINWTQKFPANHPSPRMDSTLAYDSARGVSVLFGGNTSSFNDETWEWDGNNWIQRLPVNSPPGRHSHTMVYDSKRGVTVLFGGYPGQLSHDTWEWDGINWIERQPSTYPQSRFEHAMAYNSVRGVTVLFGGFLGWNPYTVSDETWEWDGSNWKKVSLEVRPNARDYHAMTYDSARKVIVLFAGYDGTNPLGDTWEYTAKKNPRR